MNKLNPSLVTAGRQQGLSREGKNSAPKEGILFINTFDLDCRHTVLFPQKSHCVQPRCLPVGGPSHQAFCKPPSLLPLCWALLASYQIAGERAQNKLLRIHVFK